MVGAQAYGMVEKYGNLLRLIATKFLSFVFFFPNLGATY